MFLLRTIRLKLQTKYADNMSKITYKVGSKNYSFYSNLQLKGIPSIAVEQNLIEEIETDMHRRRAPKYGPMHEITIVDDNGITAVADDFSELGTLTIIKK